MASDRFWPETEYIFTPLMEEDFKVPPSNAIFYKLYLTTRYLYITIRFSEHEAQGGGAVAKNCM